jgi:Tfp pilus assembly protein PilV
MDASRPRMAPFNASGPVTVPARGGFALLEVLLALFLLALGSLGCAAGFTAALRAQEAALAQRAAVAAAAGLAERLRSVPAPSRESEAAAWRASVLAATSPLSRISRSPLLRTAATRAPDAPEEWSLLMAWRDRLAASALQLELQLGSSP